MGLRNSVVSMEALGIRRLFAVSVVDANAAGSGPADDSSFGYQVSADGQWACFVSRGNDVVPSPDAGNRQQAYRRNLVTGVTEMMSVTAGRTKSAAGNDVLRVRMSAEGRYVAFSTSATNLAADDDNVEQDTYVRDTLTGKTTLVSRGRVGVLSDGNYGAVGGELVAISGDGKYVVFSGTTVPAVFVDGATDANSAVDLYIWDRDTGAVRCVTFRNGTTTTGNAGSDGDGLSGATKFSADGRYLLYYSRASNLVPGVTDGGGNGYDVFLYDTTSGTSQYASTNAAGTTSGNGDSGFADLSNDGQFVVYETVATNLVGSDGNGVSDVLMKDRVTGTVKVISRNTSGNVANGESIDPDLSGDGRFVVYTSRATNIASPDSGPSTRFDIFRFENSTNASVLVSKNTAGNAPGSSDSGVAVVSDDGKFVAFESTATNLAANATKPDGIYNAIFLRNLTTNVTTLVSVGSSNVTGEADSRLPVLSQDGSRLLFASSVDDLVAGDSGESENIFAYAVPGNSFAELSGGVLTIRGSYLGDSLALSVKQSRVQVTRNGITLKFVPSSVDAINIDSGDGNDVVAIGTGIGATYILGGSGNDRITGGDASDTLTGAAGNDTMVGGAGDDRVDGGKGNDSLYGGEGGDRLYDGDGNDRAFGEGGIDRLFSTAGRDTLDGGSSNDKFYVADGAADVLFGGNGNDLATIDSGLDILNSIEATT